MPLPLKKRHLMSSLTFTMLRSILAIDAYVLSSSDLATIDCNCRPAVAVFPFFRKQCYVGAVVTLQPHFGTVER